MWIRLDTRRSANGEREGAPLPLNGPSASIWLIEDRLAISASAATVFALAIRRAALDADLFSLSAWPPGLILNFPSRGDRYPESVVVVERVSRERRGD